MSAELPLEDASPVDADKLRALLRKKFPADQYAMLYEVRDAAGFGASRSADAVIVGLWPSRGCLMEGVEIKISRADWLRELKKPAKAEAFVPYCDHWWIVAANQDIVRLDEIPPTWGLMVPRAGGLGIVKQAPELKAEPVDRSLLAAMLKRATQATLNTPEVRAAIEARVASEKRDFKQHESYELRTAQNRAEELRKAIKDFETASGVTISEYRGERIGNAVALVLKGEHERRLMELYRIKADVSRLNEWMQQNIADSTQGEISDDR